jgi:3-phenylpropionate/trans-cinnamate dioxygenase ferredoxin reductase subunit
MTSRDIHHTVIVGAGHAGGTVAATLRELSPRRRITLVGEEAHVPYERPPVSKEILQGKADGASSYLKPVAFYEEKSIELRLGTRATRIDRNAQDLTLSDGSVLEYDTLVLTPGARPRRLDVASEIAEMVFYVRSIEDSLAIRGRLVPGLRLTVIGGGVIGLEVAAAAAMAGCEVTVIEAAPHLMARMLPAEVATAVENLHAANGVKVMLGSAPVSFAREGTTVSTHLANGGRIVADLLVVGIGATPNVELARDAFLGERDGILVDAWTKTTDPSIFAAGDATRHYNPLLGKAIRLESWQNAQNQAISLAHVLAGDRRPYAEVPWFWSDQYDANLQIVGQFDPASQVLWRGQATDGRFVALFMRGETVIGAAALNSGGDIKPIKQLIASGRQVNHATLADTSSKLVTIVKAVQ